MCFGNFAFYALVSMSTGDTNRICCMPNRSRICILRGWNLWNTLIYSQTWPELSLAAMKQKLDVRAILWAQYGDMVAMKSKQCWNQTHQLWYLCGGVLLLVCWEKAVLWKSKWYLLYCRVFFIPKEVFHTYQARNSNSISFDVYLTWV